MKQDCWSLQVYFPNIYDIKYLMKFCGNLHGGLNKLAETLEVKRLGPQHQASLHVLSKSVARLETSAKQWLSMIASPLPL